MEANRFHALRTTLHDLPIYWSFDLPQQMFFDVYIYIKISTNFPNLDISQHDRIASQKSSRGKATCKALVPLLWDWPVTLAAYDWKKQRRRESGKHRNAKVSTLCIYAWQPILATPWNCEAMETLTARSTFDKGLLDHALWYIFCTHKMDYFWYCIWHTVNFGIE